MLSRLIVVTVRRHFIKPITTAKVHMQQQHKNIQLTKIQVDIEEDSNGATGECYFVIKHLASTGKNFSDQI